MMSHQFGTLKMSPSTKSDRFNGEERRRILNFNKRIPQVGHASKDLHNGSVSKKKYENEKIERWNRRLYKQILNERWVEDLKASQKWKMNKNLSTEPEQKSHKKRPSFFHAATYSLVWGLGLWYLSKQWKKENSLSPLSLKGFSFLHL